MNLQIPLQISRGKLLRTKSQKESIDKSIELLVNTATGTVVSDPEFGFVFTKLRFEIFDEKEGTIRNSADEDDILYKKKVSGSSKNMMTFAAELKSTVTKYEPRIDNVTVVMTYLHQQRQILVAVRGNIADTDEDYEYQTIITVWSKK